MTLPRRQLVDSSVTPYYHCISRCVRRLFLCGHAAEHRKQWIENRLRHLADVFAIEVCSYAILDNHMHLVLRLNDQQAASWTDEQVVRRWGTLFPPRGKNGKPLPLTRQWIQERLVDAEWVHRIRLRLNELGWFMKCLKEPISRLANHEENCRGAFWEPRFKSIAILDEEALLTTMAYVDLNVFAAGKSASPEDSPHTSLRTRIEHATRASAVAGDAESSVPEQNADVPELIDESHWLVPIQDCRERGVTRAGISPTMTLRSYLELLDWSSRLNRPGKARISRAAAGILERLGTSTDRWEARLHSIQGNDRFFGVVIASTQEALRRHAKQTGRKRIANFSGPPF